MCCAAGFTSCLAISNCWPIVWQLQVNSLCHSSPLIAHAVTTRRLGLVYHTNPYHTLPSWRRVFGQNSGTAIFSRHPILKARSAVFDRHEAVTHKGFTAAEVSLGASSALFVCTHFESRNANSKRCQMKQLCDALMPLASNVRFDIQRLFARYAAFIR